MTFISHSGSAFAAVAFNDRGIGFNLIVSSGQEIVSTMADYMEYALGRESTRVLALLLETVRDPQRFRAQLQRAAEADIPVVALTVGRTEGSKAMVTAHSGALAGEHGAYEAVFDAYGVHEVLTLDEMADAMELFSSPRRVRGSARGIASVHDSGGERALFVDMANDLGVPFAAITEQTRAAIDDTLDPGLEATNPLDAWGTGIDADRIFRESFLVMHEDPDTAVLAFVVDLTRQGEPYDEGYLQVAKDVFEATTKPFCIVSNLASAVALGRGGYLRDAGIPVLEGTRSGLVALRALIAQRDAADRPPLEAPTPVAEDVRDRWRQRLSEGTEIDELEGLRLLADYGIPVIPTREAGSVAVAVGAANELGWPVAIKTAAPGVQHKSDVGGVALGLADADALRTAYEDIAARLGPRVVVAPMAPKGVEVALGVVRDPTFGPLVLVAAGGVLVELMKDRQLALPPLDEHRARSLIDRLRSRPLLDGVRGAPAADVASLAFAISRLSVLAGDLGDLIAALDVNPMIVSPGGCVAVDALVIPAHTPLDSGRGHPAVAGARSRRAGVAPSLLDRGRRRAGGRVRPEGTGTRPESAQAGRASSHRRLHQRDARLPGRQRPRRHQVGGRLRAEPCEGVAVHLRRVRAERCRDRSAARADGRRVDHRDANRRRLRRRGSAGGRAAPAAGDRGGGGPGPPASRAVAWTDAPASSRCGCSTRCPTLRHPCSPRR